MGSMASAVTLKLGEVKLTESAFLNLRFSDVASAIKRHVRCDWGEIEEAERRANEISVRYGLRIRSVYISSGGTEFWVVTEGDRSNTTVLLPDEYQDELKN